MRWVRQRFRLANMSLPRDITERLELAGSVLTNAADAAKSAISRTQAAALNALLERHLADLTPEANALLVTMLTRVPWAAEDLSALLGIVAGQASVVQRVKHFLLFLATQLERQRQELRDRQENLKRGSKELRDREEQELKLRDASIVVRAEFLTQMGNTRRGLCF